MAVSKLNIIDEQKYAQSMALKPRSGQADSQILLTKEKTRIPSKKPIVLYSPKPLSGYRRDIHVPLPMLAISRFLDEEGYNIKIICEHLNADHRKDTMELCKDALCVGITSMTGHQILDGLAMAKEIKKKYPDLPIIWGGWHATLEPNQTLEHPAVDILVRGLGEETFTDLIHAVDDGRKLDGIPGISFKRNGKVINNIDRRLSDIKHFPRMPFHLVDIDRCVYNTEYGKRTVNFVSSYGCPFRCTFCEVQVATGHFWLMQDPVKIVDEIEYLVKNHKVDAIAFHDNEYLLDPKHTRAFCEELLKRNLHIRWSAYGRAKQILNFDDDLWGLMAKSGLHYVLIGAESGSQEMLDFIKKDSKVEDTTMWAEKAQKYGIKGIFSFFVGLPWTKDIEETKKLVWKEYDLTIELMDKLIAMDRRHRLILSYYTPYPGAPLYYQALEAGFKPPESLEKWGGTALEFPLTPWIPKKLMSRVELLTTYVFVFLDGESFGWVTERLPNWFLKKTFKLSWRVFEKFALFRWNHKFFRFPVDYWVYRWIKNHSALFGFYQS